MNFLFKIDELFPNFVNFFQNFDKLILKIDELFQIEELFFENDVSLFFLKSPYGQLWIDQMFNGQLNWTINASVESNKRIFCLLSYRKKGSIQLNGPAQVSWDVSASMQKRRIRRQRGGHTQQRVPAWAIYSILYAG